MQAEWDSHTRGADGVNHYAIQEYLELNTRQHLEMMEKIEEIGDKVDTLSKRQWIMTGGITVIVGVLTFLGPEGLKGAVAVAVNLMSGGWNG
jgi:hypothetical protein